MREQPKISEECLRACLQDHYDLYPVTLEFLPLGLDYHAGVYRVVSEQGTAYLLKVTSRPLYEPGCLVPRYLNDQGITAVVAPFPTKDNALWTRVEEWTVIVYPFIDGDTSWTGMTDEQWKEVGTIFQRIHQVMLPPSGFASLRKETFDPTEYARWVRAFETQHTQVPAREVPPSMPFALPGWRISPPFTRSSLPWKSWRECSKRELFLMSSVTRICIQPICCVIGTVMCL